MSVMVCAALPCGFEGGMEEGEPVVKHFPAYRFHNSFYK